MCSHKRAGGGEVLGFLRLLHSSPMDLAHGAAQGRAHYCIAFLGFSGGCFVFSCAWFVLELSVQQDAGRKGKGASRLSKENGSMKLFFFFFGGGGLKATFRSRSYFCKVNSCRVWNFCPRRNDRSWGTEPSWSVALRVWATGGMCWD